MAEYFTKFSCVIAVTPEQGDWLIQVHALATALIGHAEDGAARDGIEGPQDRVLAAMDLAEKRDGVPCIEVTYDAEGGTVWVRSEESGDVEYAAELTQAFLRRFDLDRIVAFEWANTCSKPRLDGFGGGAVVISRRGTNWFSTASFVATAAKTEAERLRLKPDEELPDLDDVVHDFASSLASDANNGSIGAQLDFLFEHGWNPPEHLLREVVP